MLPLLFIIFLARATEKSAATNLWILRGK